MIHTKAFSGRIWGLIFYQNSSSGYMQSSKINESSTPSAFSRLGQIEQMRTPSSSRYTFLLEYPELPGCFNIYSQGISPHQLEDNSTDDTFECIKCTWTKRFGPLRKYNKSSYLKHDTNLDEWWYAIGAISSYGNKQMPGPIFPNGHRVYEVKLWIQMGEMTVTGCNCRNRVINKLAVLIF